MYPANPASVVDAALDGLRLSSGTVPLEFVGPKVLGLSKRAVLTKALPAKRKVHLLSGGGSGHEPFAAGLIGEGWLTAAACGEVFASPAVSICEAAIEGIYENLPETEAVLCVILNYTGDRVNFGSAAEACRSRGRVCEVVAIGDDCATLPETNAGPRGLAGMILLLKILGAAADEGKDLAYLLRLAEEVKSNIGTMGMTYRACVLPRTNQPVREIQGCEIGLGIHGEPGMKTVESGLSSDDAVKVLGDQIVESMKLTRGSSVALLVNSLGGLSQLEFACLTKSSVEYFETVLGIRIVRLVKGALMTSLDMKGASLTAMKLAGESRDETLGRLDASTNCAAGSGVWYCAPVRSPKSSPEAHVQQGEKQTAKRVKRNASPETSRLIYKGLEYAASKREVINRLDGLAGDGDAGKSVEEIFTAYQQLLASSQDSAWQDLVVESLRAVGGSLAGLLKSFAVAYFAHSNVEESVSAVAHASQSSDQATQAGLGKRTFLDALIPALEALRSSPRLASAAAAARAGADATATLRAAVGRASYVDASKYLGHNDAGAEAVALFFEGAALNEASETSWPA